MTDHFRRKHKGEDVKEWTEMDVKMQLLFGGRLKKWFSVAEPGSEPISKQNTDAWTAVQTLLREEEEEATKALQGKEDNVSLINTFIAWTRWDKLIKGEDKKTLMEIAATTKERERLKGVTELCQNQFEAISNRLRDGDVLLRRKIMSDR
jgi:hypothetical protein